MNPEPSAPLSKDQPPQQCEVFSGKYIRIFDIGPSKSGKTRRFRIDSKEGDYEIAYASFYPKWRKYVFEPLELTVYEEICLREIADFIQAETKKWRTR